MSYNGDGGPAFPDPMRGAPSSVVNQYPDIQPTGLTIRDWFAGQALAGILATNTLGHEHLDCPEDWLASACYLISDAMIAERSRPR